MPEYTFSHRAASLNLLLSQLSELSCTESMHGLEPPSDMMVPMYSKLFTISYSVPLPVACKSMYTSTG